VSRQSLVGRVPSFDRNILQSFQEVLRFDSRPWSGEQESNRHLMKHWKNSLFLLFILSVVAILALVTAILLILRGFRATSQPSTFEKVLARNVRNFAIPTHERKKESIRGELEDRDGGSRTFL
jgi:hypothetical protein